MIELAPNSNIVAKQANEPTEHKSSQTAVALKVLLVVLLIAALVTATIFSGGAASALIAAGAASWKIGLVTVGCIASAISAIGAVYFAFKNRMFEDTEHNWEDAGNYVFNTLGTGFTFGAYGFEFIREFEIWKLITSQ